MFLSPFLNYWLFSSAVIAQTFSPTEELTVQIEIPVNEAKAVTEAHPITAETIVQCNLKPQKPFCAFYSLNHFV